MRRLNEELGLDLDLQAGAVLDYSTPVTDDLWENERVHVFYAQVDRSKITLKPDPAEVADVRWRSLSQVAEDIAANHSAYAPWFRIYIDRWPELGIAPSTLS